MTRTELKMALKLYHDWKINQRMVYARLLMKHTEGKILSIFEKVISEPISFLHKHHIRDYEIDWIEVYYDACAEMRKFAEPENLTDEEVEALRTIYQKGVSHAKV